MKKAKKFLIPLIIILILGGLLVYFSKLNTVHGIPLAIQAMTQGSNVRGHVTQIRLDVSAKRDFGWMVQSFIETYDGNGRILKMVKPAGKYQSKSTAVYNYNSRGELTEEISYMSWQNMPVRTEMTYDSVKRLTTERTSISSDGKGKLVSQNWLDRIEQSLHRKPKPKTYFTEFLTYVNDRNLPIENISRFNGKTISRISLTYKYGSKGKIASCTTIGRANTGKVMTAVMTYDDSTNPVESKVYSGSKLIGHIVISYKYDKHGNWIEKRVFLISDANGKQKKEESQITRRTITYRN
ncbi:MAG: hypothetical protein ABFD64_01055 [Armatimonadota bacterium]